MIYLIVLTFICLVFIPFNLLWNSYCFPAWDLGIYLQALYQIKWADLNPFIAIRQVHIFNDHFDPILIPFALLFKAVGLEFLFPYLDFIFFSLTGVLIWNLKSLKAHRVPMLALLLLSRISVSSLLFPIHPTTWAIFGFVLFYEFFFIRKSFALVLSSLVFLWTFKEENLFLFFSLSWILLLQKRTRNAFVALSIGMGLVFFQYYLREKLLGQTVSYTQDVLAPWKENFRQTFVGRLSEWGLYRELGLSLLPLALLCLSQILTSSQKRLKWNWNKILHLILFMLPVLGIRFIYGKWDSHYSVALLAICLGLFYALDSKLTRKQIALILLGCLGAVWTPYLNKNVKKIFTGGYDHCPQSQDRITRLDHIKKSVGLEQRIYVSGNLAPHYAALPLTYHLETSSFCSDPHEFEVIYERGGYGDHWKMGLSELEKHVSSCQSKRAHRIILEDTHLAWIHFNALPH